MLAPLEAARLVFLVDTPTTHARSFNGWSMKDLERALPMRDFARRQGQRNKPVAAWAHTMGDLVACESQLERSFVILADHHPEVRIIAAQPFTIQYPTGHLIKTHTPDFLVLGPGDVPIVVDVKTRWEAERPEWIERRDIVGASLAGAGMGYTVFTRLPASVEANLASCSAAQAHSHLDPELYVWVADQVGDSSTVGSVMDEARPDLRPHIMRLIRWSIWNGYFDIDWAKPLGRSSRLRRR